LHVAAARANLAAVELLIGKDPFQVDAADRSGHTALHWAARGAPGVADADGGASRLEVVRLLLRHGSQVMRVEGRGRPPKKRPPAPVS
jgi:ankyrin repeat protein